jgi:enoyl-CoA hydratase/carnithine racemase
MQVVKFVQKESVGHIVLANPPKNLLGSDFANALRQDVHEAGESNVRALLVRAEGPNFSQGSDLLDFLEKDAGQFRTFIAECNQSFRALEALPIPTVAAVRGDAFGGGFELVLACDFIVAAEEALFRCVETFVGSAPVAGSVQGLAERIGLFRAARYSMLCEPMTDIIAGQLGIATRVVRADAVEPTALRFVGDLSTGPTRSYAAIRALLKAWSAGGVPSADGMMLDVAMALHDTDDARRGRAARVDALKRELNRRRLFSPGDDREAAPGRNDASFADRC